MVLLYAAAFVGCRTAAIYITVGVCTAELVLLQCSRDAGLEAAAQPL
jgi:hypothetical protein